MHLRAQAERFERAFQIEEIERRASPSRQCGGAFAPAAEERNRDARISVPVACSKDAPHLEEPQTLRAGAHIARQGRRASPGAGSAVERLDLRSADSSGDGRSRRSSIFQRCGPNSSVSVRASRSRGATRRCREFAISEIVAPIRGETGAKRRDRPAGNPIDPHHARHFLDQVDLALQIGAIGGISRSLLAVAHFADRNR